ncbi:LptA/OstA family protein [Rhodospirillaceae bacterium SYSU D60014]|uniref:LptA/OstA family protein n=1 Tax=Virgifigura deserti TaxID=2268457 RepID=UPI000E6602E0
MSGSRFATLSRAAAITAMAALAMPGGTAMRPQVAHAQAVGGLDLGDSEAPVEIEAEKGIEWHRNEKVYIARGNARIARGDVVLNAEVVTAHYRGDEGANSEVWRVEADGRVRVTTPSETITGDRAVYDIDKGVIVMVGEDLRVETAEETLTAEESLEYWEDRQLVVARGNAQVVQGDKRLRADMLTGHFDQTEAGEQELVRIDAIGDVRLSTETEYARGDRGSYNLETEIATLEGSVKITRGENQLNGQRAEVNFATGVSRLLSDPDGSDGSRVRTLIVPSSESESGSESETNTP